MKRIKSGDIVIVIAGRSKGHVGKVLKILGSRVLVEGANFVKKHTKANPNKDQRGGIISLEAPLDISNVAIFNSTLKKKDKVGFKYLEIDGEQQKVRYFKSNNEIIGYV